MSQPRAWSQAAQAVETRAQQEAAAAPDASRRVELRARALLDLCESVESAVASTAFAEGAPSPAAVAAGREALRCAHHTLLMRLSELADDERFAVWVGAIVELRHASEGQAAAGYEPSDAPSQHEANEPPNPPMRLMSPPSRMSQRRKSCGPFHEIGISF